MSGPEATAGSTWIALKNIGMIVPKRPETTMATIKEIPMHPDMAKAEWSATLFARVR